VEAEGRRDFFGDVIEAIRTFEESKRAQEKCRTEF
jgi:hypothetical protein